MTRPDLDPSDYADSILRAARGAPDSKTEAATALRAAADRVEKEARALGLTRAQMKRLRRAALGGM